MPVCTASAGEKSRALRPARTSCGHHHHGAGPVLQHARAYEVFEKGHQRGQLCGRCGHSELALCPPGGFVPASCGTENRSSRRPATENCWGRRMPCFRVILQRTLCLWSTTAGRYTVRGLVTPPKSARASRAMQYLFYQWTLCQEPHDDGGAGGRL